MRLIILLYLLLVCPVGILAQDTTVIFAKDPSPIVKFSILSLLDPVSSLQFAFEYPVGKKSALQHEAGYVTRLFYNEGGDKNLQGFRLRNEYRYYFYGSNTPLQNFYVATELMYTHLWFERNERDPLVYGTGDGGFQDYPPYPVEKKIFAIHPAKAGFQKCYNRFVLDIYGGLGYRHVRVKVPSHIVEDVDEFIAMRKEAGTYNLWSLSFGFKVGYWLFER